MARRILFCLHFIIFATLLAPTTCTTPGTNILNKPAQLAPSVASSKNPVAMALFENPPEFQAVLLDDKKTLFTEEEKHMILQIHNSYRSEVQPPASDMREMVWDDDLEAYATNHTKGCNEADSGPRKIWKKWGPHRSSWEILENMGENIYHSSDQSFSINEALWKFWEKGQYYDITSNTCTKNIDCRSYLIMTSSSNWRVGCGINVCKKLRISNTGPAVFLTCSYNSPYTKGVQPYKVGKRAADCSKMESYGDKMVARFGLCVTPETLDMKKGFDGNTSIIKPRPSTLTTQVQTPPTISPNNVATTTMEASVTTQLTNTSSQPKEQEALLEKVSGHEETNFTEVVPTPKPRTPPRIMTSKNPPYRNDSILKVLAFKAAHGRSWQLRASLVSITSPVLVYRIHALFSF